MPQISNKKHALAVQQFEKMADGAVIHSGEENYPAEVKDAACRDAKQQLEDLRQAYEDALNEARRKFDAYEAKEKELLTLYSRFSTQLYGFYGKTNPMVTDFGLKPYKPTGKKGPHVPSGGGE